MIGIADYSTGNLGSILNMFRRIGTEAFLCTRPEDVARASKLVLPGVGSFDSGMHELISSGLVPAIEQKVLH